MKMKHLVLTAAFVLASGTAMANGHGYAAFASQERRNACLDALGNPAKWCQAYKAQCKGTFENRLEGGTHARGFQTVLLCNGQPMKKKLPNPSGL
jgi:hypothetical protein